MENRESSSNCIKIRIHERCVTRSGMNGTSKQHLLIATKQLVFGANEHKPDMLHAPELAVVGNINHSDTR